MITHLPPPPGRKLQTFKRCRDKDVTERRRLDVHNFLELMRVTGSKTVGH